jgi:hypothetical protein
MTDPATQFREAIQSAMGVPTAVTQDEAINFASLFEEDTPPPTVILSPTVEQPHQETPAPEPSAQRNIQTAIEGIFHPVAETPDRYRSRLRHGRTYMITGADRDKNREYWNPTTVPDIPEEDLLILKKIYHGMAVDGSRKRARLKMYIEHYRKSLPVKTDFFSRLNKKLERLSSSF